MEGLFIEFNKIIVIATFFYAVISYFLYQLMNEYLASANINPNYSPHDLFSPLLKGIVIRVMDAEKTYNGQLTNWDEAGCFLQLDQSVKLPLKIRVQIDFQGRTFEENGEVVAETLDLKGVGIKFNSTARSLDVFNWSEFTELIEELGFQPERLR